MRFSSPPYGARLTRGNDGSPRLPVCRRNAVPNAHFSPSEPFHRQTALHHDPLPSRLSTTELGYTILQFSTKFRHPGAVGGTTSVELTGTQAQSPPRRQVPARQPRGDAAARRAPRARFLQPIRTPVLTENRTSILGNGTRLSRVGKGGVCVGCEVAWPGQAVSMGPPRLLLGPPPSFSRRVLSVVVLLAFHFLPSSRLSTCSFGHSLTCSVRDWL